MISKRLTDSVHAMERVERDQNSAAVRQKRLSKLRRRVRSSIASGSAVPAALDRFGPAWNQLEIVLIFVTWIEQTRSIATALPRRGSARAVRFRWDAVTAKPTFVNAALCCRFRSA